MNELQTFFVGLWGVYASTAFFQGIRQVRDKNNPYGLCKHYTPLGAFVWADAVVFGAFFAIVSVITFLLSDFILFLLVLSLFWAIRSLGEQMYWFLEQFATNHKNPEHTLWFSKYFKRNSSWIAMQVYWQCISVISIITTVYLFTLWL